MGHECPRFLPRLFHAKSSFSLAHRNKGCYVDLMQILFHQLYSISVEPSTAPYPGDVVLDNAFGSGSFIVAAVQEGRRAVGIELNRESLAFRKESVDLITIAAQRVRELRVGEPVVVRAGGEGAGRDGIGQALASMSAKEIA